MVSEDECKNPHLRPSTSYLHHGCRCPRCKGWRSEVAKRTGEKLRAEGPTPERRAQMARYQRERRRKVGMATEAEQIASRTRVLAATYVRTQLPEVWAALRQQAVADLQMLDAFCWCEAETRKVSPLDVQSGETFSCGRVGCAPPDER